MNSIIYDLQFGFRQKYSTAHALINSTDKIREQVDRIRFLGKMLLSTFN